MISKIDIELKNIDDAICRHISNINRDSRASVSQDVLSDLRNYIEHLMLKIYDKEKNLDLNYKNIQRAKKYISNNGKYKLLNNFYKML